MFRKELPIKSGLLERTRINDLLNTAITYPLVSVLAGPGYGKTQAVSTFAKKLQSHLIWMHITTFDNFSQHFWNTLIDAVSKELPNLAERLKEFTFPYNENSFIDISTAISQETQNTDDVVFVIDDYCTLTNPKIKFFLSYLFECDFDGVTFIVISSQYTKLFTNPSPSRSFYVLSADDLRFSHAEICELFSLYDIDDVEIAKKVYSHTEGWPIAVGLCLRQLKTQYDGKMDFVFNISQINEIFEESYFLSYDKEFRLLLVKLSLLDGFSYNLLKCIYGGDIELVSSIISSNTFFLFDANKKLYFLQLMYRNFLRDKSYLLSDQEITDLYNDAGEWFQKNGYLMESVDCFAKSRNFDKMVESFSLFQNVRLKPDMANFYLDHLLQFDEKYFKKNPYAQRLLASVYLNNFETDKAKGILKKLVKQYDDISPDILGEAYIALGDLEILGCGSGFHQYYKKAAELLHDGSSIRTESLCNVDNNSFLFLDSKNAGSADKVECEMFKTQPYFKILMGDTGQALSFLYSAELAYNRYELQKTEEMAYQAIHFAMDKGHDIVCNAYFLLLRLAICQGDYDRCELELKKIYDYIEERGLSDLRRIYDTIEAYYHLMLGDTENLAAWIKGDYIPDSPPVSRGRDQSIHCLYLLFTHQYYEVIAILTRIEVSLRKTYSGFWIETFHQKLYRAIALLRIGDKTRSMESFSEVYKISYPNDLITVPIEAGNITRTLIENARKYTNYNFDKEWLDKIYQKSSSYGKRIAMVKAKYYEKTKHKTESGIKLTKKELLVLQSISQGLTREEIADYLGISINGVKGHIKNIYNKLGAINRADAIFLATQSGLLN